jgi:hypothetical protein
MWSTGNTAGAWYYESKNKDTNLHSQFTGGEALVTKGFIIIHEEGGYEPITGTTCPESYYVIDIKSQKEYTFNTLSQVKANLNTQGYQSSRFTFLNLDSIYTVFNQTGKLPWLSDDY